MQLNQQLPEKPFLHPQGALHIQEVFATIQGEGPFAGTPATFVRLAGCNIQCPACDTDYTSKRQTLSPMEVVQLVRLAKKPLRQQYTARPLVVITGGEPFRQKMTQFVTVLLGLGYIIQVETNGTLFDDEFPFDRVTIVCSPKTPRINYDLSKRVHAFKYVVQAGQVSPEDGLPLSTLGNRNPGVARPPVGSAAEIYVQPLDEQDPAKNEANLEAAVASCLTFGYRLCIQTHKLAKLP